MHNNMFRNSQKIIALILLTCIFGAWSCDTSKTKQLAKAEDSIAQGQLAVATFLKDAETSGLISQELVRSEFKPILIEINDDNKEAIAITKDWLTNGETLDKQTQLLDSIRRITNALVRLNNAGLLRIKDPQKKLAFTGLITALEGTISTVMVLVIKGK